MTQLITDGITIIQLHSLGIHVAVATKQRMSLQDFYLWYCDNTGEKPVKDLTQCELVSETFMHHKLGLIGIWIDSHSFNNIAHEAAHAALWALKLRDVNSVAVDSNEELFCYLLGYLVEEIDEILNP